MKIVLFDILGTDVSIHLYTKELECVMYLSKCQ